MPTFWRGLQRTIFWSYERGSWPYDLMVLAILLFVFLTPRHWFHDQPQNVASAAADIHLIAENEASQTKTYRLSARLLPPPKRTAKPTPELERETHDILGKSVEDLKGHMFQIQAIQSVSGDDGSIEYYDVEVKPSRHTP